MPSLWWPLGTFHRDNSVASHPATWLEGKVGEGGDLGRSARLGRSTDQKPCTRSDLVRGRHGDDHAQGVTLGKDIISHLVVSDTETTMPRVSPWVRREYRTLWWATRRRPCPGCYLGQGEKIEYRVKGDNLGQDSTVTNLWQGTGMAPACSGSDRGSQCCVFTSSQQFSDVTNVCKLVQGTTNPPPFQNAPGPHILVSHNIKLETDYNGGFFRV